MTLKRFQNEKERALYKMTNENNYPQKIKSLVEELKYTKDRNKELDDEVKRMNRVNTQVQIQNSKLTEIVRDQKKITRKK